MTWCASGPFKGTSAANHSGSELRHGRAIQRVMAMQPRHDYTKASPGTVRALFGLEVYLHGCGLERGLLHLVKLRASQINGCAYCIDMHSKDARAAGEAEQRLYGLDAWRETPFYSEKERAALELTEAVTLIHEGHVSDPVFEEVRKQYSEEEIANLTLAI